MTKSSKSKSIRSHRVIGDLLRVCKYHPDKVSLWATIKKQISRKNVRHNSLRKNTNRYLKIRLHNQKYESFSRRRKSTITGSHRILQPAFRRASAEAKEASATIDSARVRLRNDRRALRKLNYFQTQASCCISLD